MNVRDCHRQKDLAGILWDMYAVETSQAITNFNTKWPGYTITAVPNTSAVTPGTLIAVAAHQTIVIIPGTTNAWQWASQGAWGLVGMIGFAQFSTLQTWFDASQVILDRIQAAGADPTKPIIFVGHSYGAAVAQILAARFRVGNSDRTIGVLTLGSPKPGDYRLAALVASCTAVHLVNRDDPVCYIPPSGVDLAYISAVIPPVVATRWTAWVRPIGLIEQDEFGIRRDDPTPRQITNLLAGVVADLLAGNVPPETSAHWPGTYYSRIRCPGNPVPSPEPPVLQTIGLLSADLADLADGDPITEWRDSSGYIDHWTTLALPQQAVRWTVDGRPVALLSRFGQLVPSDGLLVPHAADLPSSGCTLIVAMARSTVATPAGVIAHATGLPAVADGFGRQGADVRWRQAAVSAAVADPGTDDVISVYALRVGLDVQQIWCDGVLISDTALASSGQLRIGTFGSWPALASQVRTAYLGECRKWESYLDDLDFLTIYAESLTRWGVAIPW